MTTNNLYQASSQWATRPPDERFWTLDEMETATHGYDSARVVTVGRVDRLRVEPVDLIDTHTQDTPPECMEKALVLRGANDDIDATMSNWSFEQLAGRVGAPPRYLRSLPASMVQGLLNYGLQKSSMATRMARLSFVVRDTIRLEAVTSERYGFVPNWKVVRGLKALTDAGWRVPPARPSGQTGERTRIATPDDVLTASRMGSLSVRPGDVIAPAGLYASDRDMFAFMVNETNPVESPGATLHRGIFCRNSEVGNGAFELTTFLYDAVCGNHIVWNASDVKKISIRHIGDADIRAFLAMEDDLREYMNQSPADLERAVRKAQRKSLGKSKEQVVDRLFSKRWLTRRVLEDAFDEAATQDADRVDPTTVWGMVTGLTRVSQRSDWTDARTRIDSVTSNLMAMAN